MAKLPYYTTDSLIDAIKRNNSIPSHQKTFTNDDFIAFLNEEMSLGLVPQVMKMKEDYLKTTVYIPLQANVKQYELPVRAVGNKASEISYIDPNDNVCEMTKIEISDLPFYNDARNNNTLYAYYIENNVINLVSNIITATGDLAVTYYMRPNQLVLLEEVGIIESINRSTGEIFVDAIPTGFSVTADYDFVQCTSPHKCLEIDLSPASINAVTNTITFAVADIPDNLKVGDHIALAQQSAIPQIPSDLHPMLAHRAGKRCLASLGDTEAFQVASAIHNEFEKNTEQLIGDRVEASPKKIVNRRGNLRGGLTSRRSRFRG
jgi:hypothetical protein